MKIKLFIAILLLLFVESCKQSKNLIKVKYANQVISENCCFQVPININEQNKLQKASLLFLTFQDNEFPLYYTNIYLLKNNSISVQLIADTNAIINMNEICFSPDYKYIAVNVSGEGHPWIEIYDLQSVIDSNKLNLVAEINPYPGYVSIVGWKKQKLIVNSNANLLLKNIDKDSVDFELSEKGKKFHFYLKNQKYCEN